MPGPDEEVLETDEELPATDNQVLGTDDQEVATEADTDDDDDIGGAMARDVLDYVARSIVDDPDSVTIDVEEGRRGDVRLSLHVSAGDMGKVIGRRGRVAQAIRTVVRAAGAREGIEVGVDIVD